MKILEYKYNVDVDCIYVLRVIKNANSASKLKHFYSSSEKI